MNTAHPHGSGLILTPRSVMMNNALLTVSGEQNPQDEDSHDQGQPAGREEAQAPLWASDFFSDSLADPLVATHSFGPPTALASFTGL